MTLAIVGGTPTIDNPNVIGNSVAFTPDDRDAAIQFMYSRTGRLSFYEREGLLGRYEDELAAYHGVRYAVLTNSGTSALYSAYVGLGLEPGDEVIAPTYTFLATVTPLVSLGVVPVLADADPETGNLDPDDVRRRITDATRAIVVTHQWGHPVEMDEIMQIAADHQLRVLEDTSLAVGGTYRGRGWDRSVTWPRSASGRANCSAAVRGCARHRRRRDHGKGEPHRPRTARPSTGAIGEVPALHRRRNGHNFRIHALSVAISYRRFRRIDELISQRAQRYNALTRELENSGLLRPPITRRICPTRGSWIGYTASFDAKAAGIPPTRTLRRSRRRD